MDGTDIILLDGYTFRSVIVEVWCLHANILIIIRGACRIATNYLHITSGCWASRIIEKCIMFKVVSNPATTN